MTQKVLDLLIICHILLSKHRFDLVKVPVRYVWHLVYLVWIASHMAILAIRSAYAESKTIVIALSVARGQDLHLIEGILFALLRR